MARLAYGPLVGLPYLITSSPYTNGVDGDTGRNPVTIASTLYAYYTGRCQNGIIWEDSLTRQARAGLARETWRVRHDRLGPIDCIPMVDLDTDW